MKPVDVDGNELKVGDLVTPVHPECVHIGSVQMVLGIGVFKGVACIWTKITPPQGTVCKRVNGETYTAAGMTRGSNYRLIPKDTKAFTNLTFEVKELTK